MDLSSLSPRQREIADDVIGQCAVSRIWFVENVLQVEHIELWQREELEALDAGETKLSIRSGHGVGKTTFCSWCALHFLLFRDDVKVIVTSPSLKQLTDGLIPEMQKWIGRLPLWMGSQIDVTSERATRKPNIKNNFVSFRTARKENPEALAGVHATSVMIIVDEASGVDEVIYETGQGALSTLGAIAILIGNPTKPSGFFYNTHNKLKGLWRTRRVSCEDSTRVDPAYIHSQKVTYGVDSREYRVRVKGDFPESSAEGVIPRDYAESAIGRDVVFNRRDFAEVWGLDVGRGGDPSAFVARNNLAVLEIEEYDLIDTMKVVGKVKFKWDNTLPSNRPRKIFVDSNGLGAGVADRLAELGLPVVHVNVSESSAEREKYFKLRDELWFSVRAWFEPRTVRLPTAGECPKVEKLIDELVEIESSIVSNGSVKVESKADLKKRGHKSPNIADALCLTFAEGQSVMVGSFGDVGWGNVDLSKFRAANII